MLFVYARVVNAEAYLPVFQSTTVSPLCRMVDNIVGTISVSKALYIGVNVAWKPTPSCVPQVCKFDRHVILM